MLANHLAQGKRGVFVEHGEIVAAKGKLRFRTRLKDIPITHDGAIRFQVENAMAAVAAAWGLGIPWNQIRRGLATFTSSAEAVPGRFNVMDHRGATVIIDYGHNPDAIRALVQAVESIPAQRRLVVISGAGDRRDCDLRQQTEILGEAFDEVILYQDMCQRGRADGEVTGIVAQRPGRCPPHHAGSRKCMASSTPSTPPSPGLKSGDLCLLLIDQIEEAMAHIAMRTAEE